MSDSSSPEVADAPQWVTVHARDAAAAATEVVRAHRGRVLRVVPLEEDRWQVQLDGLPAASQATDDPGPGSSRHRSLIIAAIAVGIIAICFLIGGALDQRHTASAWRGRALSVTAELDAQREATERASAALAQSQATVADLRDDVARLSADAAAAGDDAAVASAGP